MSELTTLKHFMYEDDSEKIEKQGRSFFLRTDGIIHNGINIESTDVIKCMADGKIMAMRLTDDYETVDSIKEDMSFDDNFLISYHLATKFQSGNIIKEITDNDNNSESEEKYYFTKTIIENKKGKKIEKHNKYELNSKLKDYDKIEAMFFLNEVISNNFVLIEHDLVKLNGDNIKFYSLYNHIAPLGRMTYEQRLNLPWYEHKIKLANSKVYGFYTQKGTFLPCEYSVKKISEKNGSIKIQYKNLETDEFETDDIKASYFSSDYNEIQMKTEESSQKDGIPVYIIKNGSRTFKEILPVSTEFDFDFDELKIFKEDKKIKQPLKVKYGDNQEGVIYLNEDKKFDKKSWDEAIEKFWKVINEKKDEEDFLNFQIKFKLKKGIQKNKIFFPDNYKIKVGEKIGYSGFNFMEEDKLVENTVVLKDGAAKPFTVHIETFFPDDSELHFDYKNEDKWQPFYFQINSEYQACSEKPTTEKNPSTDSYDMALIEVIGTEKLYSDEEYYKIKVIAKVIDNRNKREWVKHDFKYHYPEEPWYYYVNSDSSFEAIDNANKSISNKNIYKDYRYLQDYRSKAASRDEEGKRTFNNKEYRRVKYFYEPITKEYYVKVKDFDQMKKEKGKLIYGLAEEKHYFIQSKLDASNLFSSIQKKQITNEKITATVESPVILEVKNTKISEYENSSSENVKEIWYKTKQEGKEYWIKQSDVKTEKGGTPVEIVSLHDWSKYATVLELNDKTEYKIKDYKKLSNVHTNEEDSNIEKNKKNDKEFQRYKKQKKLNIENLKKAVKENGNSLSDNLIYKFLKNENDGRNFIFEHKNEWDNNSKLVNAYKDTTNIKKEKFENTLNAYAFMDTVKSKINNKDTFFYLHPYYFIERLDKIVSVPDFNPYEGKEIKVIHSGIKQEVIDKIPSHKNFTITVKTNPGFVPAINKNATIPKNYETYAKERFPEEYVFNDWYCSTISWEYKCPWYYESTVNKNGDNIPHTGIDWFGHIGNSVSVPIIALVNSTIWAMTTAAGNYTDSYGRMMLIKDHKDRLYLLGHLENFNDINGKQHKVGDLIKPGDVVAWAGNTGMSSGHHLHLEMLECNTGMSIEDDLPKVLDIKYNKMHNDDRIDDTKIENKYAQYRFATGTNTLWGLENSWDWKKYRLNPITGEKE